MNHSAREHVGWAFALALVSCFPALPADALEWGTHIVALGSQWTKGEPPRWSPSQAFGSLQIQHAAAEYSGDAIQLNGDSAEIGELAGSVCPPQCYVSPIGSDTNSGSSSAPWRTINKAASVASAGTTVHVAPGVYNETIAMSRSGTASKRIRFVSDVRWGAKIWPRRNLNSHIFRITGSYVDVEGFDMGPAGSNVIVFGVDTTGTNNRFAHNKIHDINKFGSNTGSAVGVGGTNSIFDANMIYHVGHSTLDHGIYVYTGHGHYLTNNIIGNTAGYGIHLWHDPDHINIFNNTTFNNGKSGILVGAGEESDSNATGCVVANNIATITRSTALSNLALPERTYMSTISHSAIHPAAIVCKEGIPSRAVLMPIRSL